MSSFSYDPSLPLNEASILPNDRLETVLSGSSDSHMVPSMSTQSSSVCTMREYEEQLNSFKRENLNLKLRIYMMENAVGFHGNDEKNALKLNVDLRVENEELKKELSDRKDLLGQAYSTLSNFEEVYKNTESKVESLEEENEKLREANRKLLSTAKRLTKGDADLDFGVDVLEDAFGTLSEDDAPFQPNKAEELYKNLLHAVFGEDTVPEDQDDLIKAVHMKVQATHTRDSEFHNREPLIEIQRLIECKIKDFVKDSISSSFKFEVQDADPVQNVESLLKKLAELLEAIQIKDQLLFRLEDELESVKKMNDDFEINANTLKDSNQDLQIRVDTKSKEIETMAKELDTKSDKLTKSYEFCQSLTKALAEQKSLVEKFKKDVKSRDGMIKKLTDEYNDLKAKVRARTELLQCHKTDIETPKSTSNNVKSDHNVNEALGALSLENCNDILKSIKEFRDRYIRKGCSSAMQCYQGRMKSVQKDVSSAVKLMRGRLEELAEFLQRLLESNEANELQRRLSKDFLETLHTSLNETRRFSTSLLSESSLLNDSLLLGENIMDEIEYAFTIKDKSIDSILIECKELNNELSAEDVHFFEDIKKEVAERIVSTMSGNNSIEVKELKSNLEEERLLVEKMSEIQLQLKKQLDVIKDESELKSEEIKRVYNELNTKNSRIEDIEYQIQALTKEIDEYKEREGSIKSSYMEEVLVLKSQLSETVTSKEELQHELNSLIEEKDKILQCCSENENLKEELRRAKEELQSLNDILAKDKAKRAEIEKQMTKQLAKTRKVLKQTRQIGSEGSNDKEN